jgi:hypothetical protein
VPEDIGMEFCRGKMSFRGSGGESDDDWPSPPTPPGNFIGCEEDQKEKLEETSIDEDYSLLDLDQELIEKLDTFSRNTDADTFIKIAYRIAIVKSQERKRSQEEVDEAGNENEEEYNEIALNHRLKVRAYNRLSTWKKRKDYATCKLSPISSFHESILPVSEAELEIAFARLILENNGRVYAGSSCYKEFLERSGYQKKMKELGNPKAFFSRHALRGFQILPVAAKLGDGFGFRPPHQACKEWMQGHCPRILCPQSHALPRGCNKIPSKSAIKKPSHQLPLCKYFPNCTRGAVCRYFHPQRPEPCRYFPDCKYGSDCRFFHPQRAPPSLPFRSFDWSRSSRQKKYLVLGTTEEGKQSFTNALHQYFANNSFGGLTDAVSNLEIQGRNFKANCHRFKNPDCDETSLTFVDTPALTDFENSKNVIWFFSDQELFFGVFLLFKWNGEPQHSGCHLGSPKLLYSCFNTWKFDCHLFDIKPNKHDQLPQWKLFSIEELLKQTCWRESQTILGRYNEDLRKDYVINCPCNQSSTPS